jgi:hypothetical protein
MLLWLTGPGFSSPWSGVGDHPRWVMCLAKVEGDAGDFGVLRRDAADGDEGE